MAAMLLAADLGGAAHAAAQDAPHVEMEAIAVLGFAPICHVVCGDADRDQHAELYLHGLDSLGHAQPYALEYATGYRFDTVPLSLERMDLWAIGDGDRDLRADLVAQWGPLRVYEGASDTSLPAVLVWEDAVPSHYVAFPVFADLDCDSAPEIVTKGRDQYVVDLYETSGDNSYERVEEVATHWGLPYGFGVAHDMDGDGRPELAVGTDVGYVELFEAVADDSLAFVAYDSTAFEYELRAVAGADDMDRDGHPECVAVAVLCDGVGVVLVYESPSSDTLVPVWTADIDPGYFGESTVSVGDVDGDSVQEFVVADGRHLRLYKCTGNDEYQEIWSIPGYAYEVALYDIDDDGRDELIHRTGAYETTIRRYVEVGVAEREIRRLEGVQVTPTLVRPGEVVRLDGTESRFSVQVLDAAGRVVAEPVDGVWRTDGVSPGVYFFRFGPSAARCQPSAVSARKVLVVE